MKRSEFPKGYDISAVAKGIDTRIKNDRTVHIVNQFDPVRITTWESPRRDFSSEPEPLRAAIATLDQVEQFVSEVGPVHRLTLEELATRLTTALGYGLIDHTNPMTFDAEQKGNDEPFVFETCLDPIGILFTEYWRNRSSSVSLPSYRLIMENNPDGGIDQVSGQRVLANYLAPNTFQAEIDKIAPLNFGDRSDQMKFVSMLRAASLFNPRRLNDYL